MKIEYNTIYDKNGAAYRCITKCPRCGKFGPYKVEQISLNPYGRLEKQIHCENCGKEIDALSFEKIEIVK